MEDFHSLRTVLSSQPKGSTEETNKILRYTEEVLLQSLGGWEERATGDGMVSGIAMGVAVVVSMTKYN